MATKSITKPAPSVAALATVLALPTLVFSATTVDGRRKELEDYNLKLVEFEQTQIDQNKATVATTISSFKGAIKAAIGIDPSIEHMFACLKAGTLVEAPRIITRVQLTDEKKVELKARCVARQALIDAGKHDEAESIAALSKAFGVGSQTINNYRKEWALTRPAARVAA